MEFFTKSFNDLSSLLGISPIFIPFIFLIIGMVLAGEKNKHIPISKVESINLKDD